MIRTIETASYAAIRAPRSFGEPPRLQWLAIAALVIDPEYQREISTQGRKNVRNIASAFDWSMFAPVIVSPAGRDTFAIVDGQHRTTAAALCGIDQVPCAIIEVERAGQARAFGAINGNTTRMHPLQLYHAAVAAGDKVALHTADVCRRAGITVMRSPTTLTALKPHQTCTVATIGKAFDRFGEKPALAGLRAIAAIPGEGSQLHRTIIWGTIEVLHDHPEWCADQAALNAAFETFDLDELWRRGTAIAARTRGSSSTDQFEAQLVEALQKAFAGKTRR